ncbi:MAG TPA: peptide ABC transporter substrate-binding protein [Pseudomonadales bacterium]|nr:peptide ABC transporter substrate-binding protein [Pseudomonadales bacterium]
MKQLLTIIVLLSWSLVATAGGVDTAAKKITLSLPTEPPNLDSSHTEDTTSGFVLSFTNEGLIRIGPHGEIIPAVADHWEMGDKEVTFHLRPDARWDDGKPIRAQDFVYSWRRLVNPKTGARGSTFFAYVIKNADDILAGRKPPESLGVEAIDDHTLRVTLSRPVPYILTVLTGTAYFPLRQDFVEAQHGRYGADAKNLMSDGAFKLVSWIHNGSIVLKKNPQYWDKKDIKLNEVDIGYITSDTRSLFNLYKSNELATLTLDENILADAQKQGARIHRAPTNCLAWLDFNMRPGRITSNLKVRQAIRYAFDRDSYVNDVVSLPGTRKIESVFTRHINGISGTFQDDFPATPIPYDPAKGRQLMAEALKELGLSKLPPIVLLANETREQEAEFVQSQLMGALGIDVRVDKQSFKQAIAKMNGGDFDIARQGFCGGALTDPVFFAGIFDSTSPFDNGGYSSPEYDRLMAVTNSTGDEATRMHAFAKMQTLLFKDIPIIPIYENSVVYVQDKRVRGLVRFPITNFSRGYIAP